MRRFGLATAFLGLLVLLGAGGARAEDPIEARLLALPIDDGLAFMHRTLSECRNLPQAKSRQCQSTILDQLEGSAGGAESEKSSAAASPGRKHSRKARVS